jgi:hypothetical protein
MDGISWRMMIIAMRKRRALGTFCLFYFIMLSESFGKTGENIIDGTNDRDRSPMSNEEEQGKASLEKERRGSILSIWRKGKDEHGNHAIVHDDEEYSQADRLPSRTSSDSASRPKQREELPTSSFFV